MLSWKKFKRGLFPGGTISRNFQSGFQKLALKKKKKKKKKKDVLYPYFITCPHHLQVIAVISYNIIIMLQFDINFNPFTDGLHLLQFFVLNRWVALTSVFCFKQKGCINVRFLFYFSSEICITFICTHAYDIGNYIQSTLVISNSNGLSKILRDIRTSTYQICRIEQK